jgi:hypothetical protein|tara:strand:- start:84 stop:350 length:267 start_codon:yes stop_codon:yes gene_type:complete
VGDTFQIGDLVRCIYDLYGYYHYDFDEWSTLRGDDEDTVHYGIIVDVESEVNRQGLGYAIIYSVYCLDGKRRYFVDWEIECLHSLTSS